MFTRTFAARQNSHLMMKTPISTKHVTIKVLGNNHCPDQQKLWRKQEVWQGTLC